MAINSMTFLASMRHIKKIAIISSIFLCIIVIILSGMGLYLYYHPEHIKSMIERSLSATTGSSCTMESLSGSFQPMVLEARGVFFETTRPQQAFSMELPFIRADMSLGGAWNHRSLILENIKIKGISVNVTLPAVLPEEKGTSFPARMVQGLVGLFFFRDIIFQSGEIFDGHISASWQNQTIQARQIHANAGTDKPLFLSFAMEVNDSSRNLHITAPNVNIVSQNAFDMKDLKFSGTLQAEDIKLQDAVPWQVSAKMSIEDLAFKNKSGSLMGEKISLTTKVEGLVDIKHPRITFAASLQVKAGEALYDRYYLNLAKNPIVTSCNGTYQFQQRLLQLSKLRFDLTDILPFEIQGFLKQGPEPDADFTVTIPQVPLKPLFHHLLQEPYKIEMPLLEALEAGGAISAEIRIKEFENARQVTGRIGWIEGNLTFQDKGIILKGIGLDLPVWYWTGLAQAPVEGLKGKFEVQSATLPPLPEQPLNILLDVGPNRISVDSPTVIRVPGGDLRLGSVHVKNYLGPDISVHTRLAVDGIKLQPLLSGIATLPPGAALSGVLDPVEYEKNTVTSQGEIAAKVFGGQIIISDLEASGILTSAPVFKFNALWDDLLLAEITTDTTFGKIEGVLKGYINDIEIADGQPQKFILLLETVQKKGVPQTISIKAIDNIAQIGGGQSPFMGLAGAFASVFKKFPYEKIGMQARLENDMFTINGTIREDGTEYLVKRRGFSGVNIVNQNPDNRISFKDMVKRIQRITQGEAVVE